MDIRMVFTHTSLLLRICVWMFALTQRKVSSAGATDCTGRRCWTHATCSLSQINTCQCLRGFRWLDVSTKDECVDIDECSNHFNDPCGHRGRCRNTLGSYTCTCLAGWSNEPHCDMNTSLLPDCMPGYVGHMCSQGFCGQNGYAMQTTQLNNFICICRKGWSQNGSVLPMPCDTDVDECSLNPPVCHNGGQCHNSPGHYHCGCVQPWIGTNCTRYNCKVSYCMNGGQCDQGTCRCPARWSGADCSSVVQTTVHPPELSTQGSGHLLVDTVIYTCTSVTAAVCSLFIIITVCWYIQKRKRNLRRVSASKNGHIPGKEQREKGDDSRNNYYV